MWKLVFLSFFVSSSIIEARISSGATQNAAQGEVEWNYDDKGPLIWPYLFNTCSGNSQSPVNIEVKNTPSCSDLTRIVFRGYNRPLPDPIITNNGETVRVDPSLGTVPSILQGGLPTPYNFLQLHFHWGDSNDKGSEHTVNGQRAPLEMHLVHRNNRGDTAVLAVFFEVSSIPNKKLEPIISELKYVTEPGRPIQMSNPVILHNLLPSAASRYFRYEGSLTTPPCTEGVIWTIFERRLPIGKAQLQQFRTLLDGEGDPLVNNFRPVQPLNGRVVKRSKAMGTPPQNCQ